ncbi:hypothetical protein KSP40_PGU011266 [Platanthera guangdongensis]|uniref:Uncharacterized protein n=1 Tax=Platanthera guangdongensis TaxID=2320717 RepID=A0ABR2N630_9ASPA
MESGLWGWKCKSSIIEKENCALRCLSPACYQLIYESDPLEEGERDFNRSHEYKYCLHSQQPPVIHRMGSHHYCQLNPRWLINRRESLGESLEGVKGAFD